MTIQELYAWAKENNIVDYDLSIDVACGDDGIIELNNMKIDQKYKCAVVADY